MNEVFMMVGFLLAGYSVVANDSIQTLGTFLISNAHRPWWLLWLFSGGVMVAVFLFGHFTGDISYGRLAKIPEVPIRWWILIPPAVLLILTRCGIPVSTTFLILTVFNPRGLGSMLTKSLLGYGVALAVGYLVYRLVMRVAERRFIETSKRKPAPYWVALQWMATAFLWSQWLIQDLANIAVYLPRKIALDLLIVVIAVMLALNAWICYVRNSKIQRIITTKTNTADIRSATVIDFIFGRDTVRVQGDQQCPDEHHVGIPGAACRARVCSRLPAPQNRNPGNEGRLQGRHRARRQRGRRVRGDAAILSYWPTIITVCARSNGATARLRFARHSRVLSAPWRRTCMPSSPLARGPFHRSRPCPSLARTNSTTSVCPAMSPTFPDSAGRATV